MRRIRCILVAVKDSAAGSLPALAKGAQLARSLAARLVLFQALAEPLYLDGDFARLRSLRDIERDTRFRRPVPRRRRGARYFSVRSPASFY